MTDNKKEDSDNSTAERPLQKLRPYVSPIVTRLDDLEIEGGVNDMVESNGAWS